MYGRDSAPLKEGRVAAVQGLSGTGALRVAGEFFRKFLGEGRRIYQPDPTWGNHIPIFKNAGLEPEKYRYYDRENDGLDFNGMKEDLAQAPDGSIILLHACAHNPTGKVFVFFVSIKYNDILIKQKPTIIS